MDQRNTQRLKISNFRKAYLISVFLISFTSCRWHHGGGLYRRTLVFDNPTSWMNYYNSDYVDGDYIGGDKSHLMVDASSASIGERVWTVDGIDYCYLNQGESNKKLDNEHYLHVLREGVYERCELPYSYDTIHGVDGEMFLPWCYYYLTFLPVSETIDFNKLEWAFLDADDETLEYTDKAHYNGNIEKQYRFLLKKENCRVAILEIHGIPLDQYDQHTVDEEARDKLIDRLAVIRENILSIYKELD